MTDLTDFIARLDTERSILIGGIWRGATDAKTFPVSDPATEKELADVAFGSELDARLAVDAAEARFEAWSLLSPRTRSELLSKVRELMIRDADDLASLISAENGKSQADARAEVIYAAEFFRWYAEEAVRPHGDFGTAPAGGVKTIVTSRPVGIAALVTPWNFPAAMATRKIAPALAAGCTVVLKPASETPLTALAIGRLIAEAGIPDGVVNIVTTKNANSVVSTWLEDDRVRKISFTGSTGIGRQLLRQAADRVVNASMELGGCAPFIVAEDADIDAAVDGAMVAKFRNGGQACTAANTFFIHASVAEEFTAAFTERVNVLKVGPADAGADMGPLISQRALDDVTRMVELASSTGARIVSSATTPEGPGHFYPPTVITDVPANSPLVTQEIFGPVAPIVTWSSPQDLFAMVNSSDFGLASYVYAGDLRVALRIAENLNTGMVGTNRGLVSDPSAPFGGTKQSGLGREGGREGLEEYLETQYFSIDW